MAPSSCDRSCFSQELLDTLGPQRYLVPFVPKTPRPVFKPAVFREITRLVHQYMEREGKNSAYMQEMIANVKRDGEKYPYYNAYHWELRQLSKNMCEDLGKLGYSAKDKVTRDSIMEGLKQYYLGKPVEYTQRLIFAIKTSCADLLIDHKQDWELVRMRLFRNPQFTGLSYEQMLATFTTHRLGNSRRHHKELWQVCSGRIQYVSPPLSPPLVQQHIAHFVPCAAASVAMEITPQAWSASSIDAVAPMPLAMDQPSQAWSASYIVPVPPMPLAIDTPAQIWSASSFAPNSPVLSDRNVPSPTWSASTKSVSPLLKQVQPEMSIQKPATPSIVAEPDVYFGPMEGTSELEMDFLEVFNKNLCGKPTAPA